MRGEAEGSDAGVAQEAARRRATRRVSLAAHVSVRGMAEAGRLTVGGRVARLRAYGLGDTRGASGASPKIPPCARGENYDILRSIERKFMNECSGVAQW